VNRWTFGTRNSNLSQGKNKEGNGRRHVVAESVVEEGGQCLEYEVLPVEDRTEEVESVKVSLA